MTVPADINRITYTGNDSTDTYAYPFKIFEDTDLQVYEVLIETGVATLLELTTDYTVDGVGDDEGGNVVLVDGDLPSTKELLIVRSIPITQETDYEAGGPLPSEAHEDALDRIVMICQQLQEQIDRALKVAIQSEVSLEFPQPEAGKALRWNDDADGLENYTPESVEGGGLTAPIVTGDIADLAITAAKLAVDAVTTTNILDSAVTAAKILDGAVTAAKLAADAVTTTAILDAAVTFAKMSAATKDEDAMTSNSDVHVPTQQSVKAYVDARIVTKVITTSGNWTAPTGVNYVEITIVGGGGGGGGGAHGGVDCGGGGGGGGQTIKGVMRVTPAAAHAVVVGTGGAGGTGGSSGTNGANGVASSFAGADYTLTAQPGNGGVAGDAVAGGAGGIGGQGSVSLNGQNGDVDPTSVLGGQGAFPGGDGGSGETANEANGGGGGASQLGRGGSNSGAAVGGAGYLGGGGGGGNGQSTGKAGGAGGAGIVILKYAVNGAP